MTQLANVVEATAIRPFQVNVVPEAELTDLRRRVNATRWPERETVADASQGVQFATTQKLARFWATEHDWRGSVIEQLKIIEPLTNPTAHGGSAADAFHVVIPSLPGYGFSGKPRAPGWNPARVARAWATLMQRL